MDERLFQSCLKSIFTVSVASGSGGVCYRYDGAD